MCDVFFPRAGKSPRNQWEDGERRKKRNAKNGTLQKTNSLPCVGLTGPLSVKLDQVSDRGEDRQEVQVKVAAETV